MKESMKYDPARYQNLCSCQCHYKGANVMHDMACCNLSSFQYINADKTIDREVVDNAILATRPKRPVPRIEDGEYIVKSKYDYDTSKVKDKRRNRDT